MISYSSKTGFGISERSLNSLKDVHPLLVSVTVLALFRFSDIDFVVIEGLRSLERQKELYKDGHSQTLKSKHLRQDDGFSHAVDLAPLVNGTIPWAEIKHFVTVGSAMKQAAEFIGVSIEWGGNWESFKDYPHYQLKER